MAEIPEEVREQCVEAVARNAWVDMTRSKPTLPAWENLSAGMRQPMIDQVVATLKPIWPIIERGTT